MFLKTKKRICELIDTVSEMLGVICRLSNSTSAILDCSDAIQVIYSELLLEEHTPQKTLTKCQIIREKLNLILDGSTKVTQNTIEELGNNLFELKNEFQSEIKPKLKILFLPYKAAMWDSLETIYEAAVKDEDCIAKVVPIPYYKLSQNEATPSYEGESFPRNIPIIHYDNFNLEEEQPDIIFVHNIYDQYNTITRVFEQYFTSNLKKYTDMLVYVPYHISSFIPPKPGGRSMAYNIPTISNVDKIVLAADFLIDSARRDGIDLNKLLALGSPKFDAMLKTLTEDTQYPSDWKEKIKGKTVYLLNTGCLFFSVDPFVKVNVIANILNIPNIDKDSALIWRPHPLTKISILKYTPYLADYYDRLTNLYIKKESGMYNNIIIDETDSYLPALKVADVLISSDGSLLRAFLATGKKVLFLDKEMPAGSMIPANAFYYFYDSNEPWYDLVKKFPDGYDPLAQNRKGLAAKVYANADGTCGTKVYQSIKESVLKTNTI